MRVSAMLPFGLAWLATGLLAQNPANSNGYGNRVDSVVATINDSAVLLSEVRTVADGVIRSAEARTNGQLPPSLRERILREGLEKIIKKHQLALAAKTLGQATPEQIEAIFQSELDRKKKEDLREFGSYTNYGIALKEQGRTWQTEESEKRIDVMHDIAQSLHVWQRLHQHNLVTPRMLREAWRIRREEFQHDAQAEVQMLRFTGADAPADAERASSAWSLQPRLTSRELAARFPGSTGVPDTLCDRLDTQLEAIAAFGRQGPALRVSPPMALADGAVYVVKISAHLPAKSQDFSDPQVQEELRRWLLDEQLLRNYQDSAQNLANRRTEVWRTRDNLR